VTETVERRRDPMPAWHAAAAGVIAGLALGVITQTASTSGMTILGLPLYGNAALILVAVGIPLAIYAGWVWLAGATEGRDLAVRFAVFGAALVIGAYPFSLIFGVPALLVGGGTYALFATGRLPAIDPMYWLVVVIGLVISALPTAGPLGLGIPPAVAAFALRDADRLIKVAAGAGIAAALLIALIVVPAALQPLLG
jgi:hypothetical protein